MSDAGSKRVYANSEEIRGFARELARFCDNVEEFDTTIRRDLTWLGNTFRDDGYEQFCDQFAKSRQSLAKFLVSGRLAAKDLEHDAAAIDKFHSVKPRL